MKNVLLLGDSIRQGYDVAVKRALQGKAEVFFPKENCRFAAYVLRYLYDWKNALGGAQIDVVHWNAGLWDCLRLYGEEPQTPIPVYVYYLDRVCERLKKLFPGAHFIFATSTRVQSERMDADFKRYNEEIEVYNAAAVEEVTKHGMEIDDLYALSAALPEEAHSDPVHYYTNVGTEAFAKRVLACLAPHLGLGEPPIYVGRVYEDDPVGM